MSRILNNLERAGSIPPKEELPAHVAIIMDGNGRWAKERRMPRSMGHKSGVERVRGIVKMCDRIGIKALTIYAFSTENWARPKDEVSILMQLLIEYLKNEMDELNENNVKFRSIGDRSALSKELQAAIDYSEKLTEKNTGLILTVAINYGSRDEIFRAARIMAEKYKNNEYGELTRECFEKELFTESLPEVDLLIRTSGEYRISNFLLYQIAYSEFYFTQTYWPDFDDDEFALALRSYAQRSRRFGGV